MASRPPSPRPHPARYLPTQQEAFITEPYLKSHIGNPNNTMLRTKIRNAAAALHQQLFDLTVEVDDDLIYDNAIMALCFRTLNGAHVH